MIVTHAYAQRRRRDRLSNGLDGLIRPFQKIDKTILERVLGTDDHQAVLLDELFEQLRPVPQLVRRHANVGPDRLTEEFLRAPCA